MKSDAGSVDLGENEGCLTIYFSSSEGGSTGACMLSNDRRRLGFELKKGKQMGGGGSGGAGGGIGKGCELPSVKVQ